MELFMSGIEDTERDTSVWFFSWIDDTQSILDDHTFAKET
jgi:hypothetical protein